MIKHSVINILLWSSVGYAYSMESICAHVSERYRYMAMGCLALVITGLTFKQVRSYCLKKEKLVSQEPQVTENISLKYDTIRVRLNDLKMRINSKAKPLDLLEKDRLALLQEIIPDIVLEGKTEKEIHQRIMHTLCPVNKLRPAYPRLAHAVGDVNQALLDLKKGQSRQQK